MRAARVPVVLMIALLSACGGAETTTEPENDNPSNPSNPSNPGTPNNPGTPGTPPNARDVNVNDNSFGPDSVDVAVGGTVTWTWAATYAAHNVTFAGGETSGDKTSGEYSRAFTAAGTYAYNCTIHGTAMKGVVKVR